MERRATFWQRHPLLRDGVNLAAFVVAVVLGTFALNQFVFRSYNVLGHSMYDTLIPGERILVNRLPVTAAHLLGQNYIPRRGQIIVFRNPRFATGDRDEFIIKRVIGLPGERVIIEDGHITVWTDPRDASTALDPDELHELDLNRTFITNPIDTIIPDGEVFVVGDNRGDMGGVPNSYDSRNGLGTIPLPDVVGPAAIRIFPLDSIRTF
ncbi:signal peptidase I [Candidatus Saccharibacteria bacterium]|nr:signal peptidase I [Candidatus Saccharibacteria bacterium]